MRGDRGIHIDVVADRMVADAFCQPAYVAMSVHGAEQNRLAGLIAQSLHERHCCDHERFLVTAEGKAMAACLDQHIAA